MDTFDTFYLVEGINSRLVSLQNKTDWDSQM